MSDNKPIYYGTSSRTSPIYYGSSNRMSYGGGKGPVYYGRGGAYGAYGSYGAYGQYGSASGAGPAEDGSIVGTITLSRMLRVVSQRWLSVFVFLLVGLLVAFAVFRISPTIYEARSEFTLDMRRATGGRGGGTLDQAMPDYGSSYEEIFNTRISDWRSEKIVAKILQQYRANRPTSTVSDEELIGTLAGSKLELVRHSRLISISVRSKVPALCADIANAYAESIESFTDEENKLRCDAAVKQIHANVEKKRQEVDKINKQLLDFRTANKIDNLRSTRETLDQALKRATADVLSLETERTQLIEWEKMLAAVQKDPTTYGSLAVNVPRAGEIASEFQAYQKADGEYQTLLFSYTENHPEVVTKKKESELARQRFLDAAARALLTGRSTLKVTQNQLANLKTRQNDLKAELAAVEQRIVLAESGLVTLENERDVANKVLEELYLNENKARLDAESNNEIVRVGRPANVPTKPVLPNPFIIFGAGTFISIALGLLFVLVLDNLEDTIVNLADIEGRLALKVLAVLPHVRRRKREEVARHLIEDRYSQFSESVAGLRNLLDSPRYEALSHCMLVISTQPAEGKTITSTSLAIAYAQSGKKTLHVDFDLRRPRLARIWGLELTPERSFSHALQNSGEVRLDFSSLVNATDVKGLDVIASLPPVGVTPATIFGSAVVAEFFEWARANYDRVIIDSPPYGVVGDVVSLSVIADSVLIMCCPDRTHFKPIQHCSRCLAEAGANILGVVVNDVEISSASAFSPSSHHYGMRKYGYGYGYGYRPEKEAEQEAEAEDADAGEATSNKDYGDEE